MTAIPVAYVIGSLNIGGAERHLAQVLPRLDRSRWLPSVYCLTERGELAPVLEAAGIPVICSPVAPPPAGASRALRLRRIAGTTFHLTRSMRERQACIAHFFLPAAYILGAPAAIMARVPIRVMSRRSLNDYQRGTRLSRTIEGRLHPMMTAVLGNSLSVVRQLRDDEGVRPDRLGLIYNGIDLSPFRTALRRSEVRASLGIGDDALVFVIVANLIPYKGHRDLIAAFGRAHARLPGNWRLLVVGRDDGVGAGLREQASALGIGDHLVFLGPRRDVPDLLRSADVGILSSHQEGFSNAILESMAAGLPTIATNVGGNPEAVIDGETGLIVAPHDADGMSAAIERLAADAGLRARLGEASRRRVEACFGLDACTARYEEFYAGLLARKKPSEIDGIRFPA
jgi:glycosyltransferase involved in cell wall biosynthesis